MLIVVAVPSTVKLPVTVKLFCKVTLPVIVPPVELNFKFAVSYADCANDAVVFTWAYAAWPIIVAVLACT